LGLALLGSALAIAIAGVIYLSWLMRGGDGELAMKPVWADLQGLEIREAADPRRGPLLMRRFGTRGYAALGIVGIGEPTECPCTDPPRRAWLILNDHSPGREIHQVVHFREYDLPCGTISRVHAAVPDMDDHVLGYLGRICRPGA
jgi:hypothetical protein